MKLIATQTPFTINNTELTSGPYPPCGFLPLPETDLGNGDCFGLYWPLGYENQAPVVCELYHDEWLIKPAFSNAVKLSEWLKLNDYDPYENQLTIDDTDFSVTHFEQGKNYRSSGDTDNALHHIRAACRTFPEVSEYWLTLASLCMQTSDQTGASVAALNGFLANWAFGVPHDKIIYFLKMAVNSEIFQTDPVVQRVAAGELTLHFGGVKENNNYRAMTACINDYLKLNKPLNALRLLQNYAFVMSSETTAFQARYHFSLGEWQTQFSELCLTHTGDNRRDIQVI